MPHLGREPGAHLQFGLGAELDGQEFSGPCPKAMADVIAGDHQVASIVALARQHDMGVGVLRVEMIGGDPIELGAEVAFRGVHEIADERLQVIELLAVLRRHDETELVAVGLIALEKRIAVHIVAGGVVEAALLALAGHTVPLNVAQVQCLGLGAAAGELDKARLDDDPPGEGARRTRRSSGPRRPGDSAAGPRRRPDNAGKIALRFFGGALRANAPELGAKRVFLLCRHATIFASAKALCFRAFSEHAH